jgi:SH3-like domain-containing protein
MMRRGLSAAMVALSVLSLGFSASADPVTGADSNLPVPRFVSLRTEGANGRHGPGLEHKVDWIYERAGLPLQVTGESGPWRRVRDPDGAEVWMHAQNLDPRRTIYVRQEVAMRRNSGENGRVLAYVRPGVVGALTGCEGQWRRMAVGGRVGWVRADAVWGAETCEGV